MTTGMIFSRIQKVFPSVTFREVLELINDAVTSEFPDILNKKKTILIDMVTDQRYYALPQDVIKINKVFVKSSDGTYRPISRLVGFVDTGDIT